MIDDDKTFLIEIRKPIRLPDNAILIHSDGTFETVGEYRKRKGITDSKDCDLK